jgi:hypothetical protein
MSNYHRIYPPRSDRRRPCRASNGTDTTRHMSDGIMSSLSRRRKPSSTPIGSERARTRFAARSDGLISEQRWQAASFSLSTRNGVAGERLRAEPWLERVRRLDTAGGVPMAMADATERSPI